MQRRKFLVGMGSLAAGGAAAMGTGAFTSVEADRQVDVEVAGDANAYLGLEPGSGANGDYVVVDNGEVSFDFSGADGDSSGGGSVSGDGFNPDAVTTIDNLLKVTNQGTQTVDFEVDLSNLSTGSATVTISTDEEGGSSDLTSTPVSIPAGNSIQIDVKVDTNGQGPANTSGSIEFIANAT